jgi:hypothetical protein
MPPAPAAVKCRPPKDFDAGHRSEAAPRNKGRLIRVGPTRASGTDRMGGEGQGLLECGPTVPREIETA